MAWRKTDLSTVPPVRQMGSGDRESFGFDAQQAIVAATAKLIRLDTGAEVPAGVESVGVGGGIATVTVSGLIRGVDYELAVSFQTAAGRRWTRVLAVQCVA